MISLNHKIKDIKELRHITDGLSLLKQMKKPYPIKHNFNPVIPLNIFQTWHTKNLPPKMFESINLIKNLNPRFNYNLFDDNDCREFIKNNFDQDILNAFDTLIPGAYKADLWRYCVLYKLGGIYLDIKYRPVNGFRFINLCETEHWVLDVDGTGIYNALMVCLPGNKILFKAIHKIVENVKNTYYGINALEPTGPLLLSQFFSNSEKNKFDMRHSFYGSHENRFIHFNDHLIFKSYSGYLKEHLTNKKVSHYQYLWLTKNIYNIMNNKWVVLLTTAVNAKNNDEDDIKNRKIIYSNQICNWLTKTNMHIFVIESTGVGFPNLHNDRLTVITTKLPVMASSSQSEASSMLYALNEIKDNDIFKNCTHILKVTGRYFLHNIENKLKNVKQNLDVYLQIHKDDKIKWQNTEYYGIKKELVKPFLENVLENKLMENAFYNYILSNNLSKQTIGPFKNNIQRGGDGLIINPL